MLGGARRCPAWQGGVCAAKQGKVSEQRGNRSLMRRGEAGPGAARQGGVRQGKARPCAARWGAARHGKVFTQKGKQW